MTDIPEIKSEDAVNEMISAIEEKNRIDAQRKANKILSKNSRELNRLYKHAQDAAITGNFDAYAYAIKKSRDILKQPYTDELIETLWETTRLQIKSIIEEFHNDNKNKI